MLAAYMGSERSSTRRLKSFAIAYADQMTLEYEKFRDSIRNGRIKASAHPF